MAPYELLESGRLASARALDQASIGITHRYTLDTVAVRNVEGCAGRGAPGSNRGRHGGTTASRPRQACRVAARHCPIGREHGARPTTTTARAARNERVAPDPVLRPVAGLPGCQYGPTATRPKKIHSVVDRGGNERDPYGDRSRGARASRAISASWMEIAAALPITMPVTGAMAWTRPPGRCGSGRALTGGSSGLGASLPAASPGKARQDARPARVQQGRARRSGSSAPPASSRESCGSASGCGLRDHRVGRDLRSARGFGGASAPATAAPAGRAPGDRLRWSAAIRARPRDGRRARPG